MPVKTYGGVATRAYKLRSRIPLIMGELDPAMMDAMMELAERIVDGAKQRVPVESGALQEAIHIETEEDRAVPELVKAGVAQVIAVVAGDSEAFYGHIVENGSVYQPPHPFLVPAFEAEKQNLKDIAGEKLKDHI